MTHIRYYIILLLTLLSTLARAEGDEPVSSGSTPTTPNVTIGGSVYGGGKMGAILDTESFSSTEVIDADGGRTNVTIHNAVIGTDESVEDGMGNVFGGGFGPAARVMHTKVKMYDGVIRNGLYGGGEIAAVGYGIMDPPIDKVPRLRQVVRQGTATVEMYHGHVERDVFGGGRGYTYALDDGSISAARLYTDGYVFGSTKVRIYGGVIGTKESMKEGYGNVFGGGNVGFMYSGNEKKITGTDPDIKNVQFLENGKPYYVIPHVKDDTHPSGKESYFYADPADAVASRAGDLSIACDVLIEPRCRAKSDVTVNSHEYKAGEYVRKEDLDFLQYKEKSGDTFTKVNTDIWNKLEDDGITIYNAVFAGGNVSTGDDKVYAETTTVYGNVVATVDDLYYRDLVTIGTSSGKEHTGGLYGDGNLTFVDGYRELSLSNYGTDYDNLTSEVTSEGYEALNDREKTYYQSKYRCIIAQDPYKVGQTVDESIYESFTEEQKLNNWEFAGFRSRYAGRLLNTIQRADFAGVFGSRLVLQGAMDRVLTKEGDHLSFEDYTINRIGELSLNKQPSPGQSVGSDICRGNYFGIYNKVNYLGALTSDVRFGKDTTDEGDGADVWEDTEDGSSVVINSVSHDLTNSTNQSYYNWKLEYWNEGNSRYNISQLKNLGTSKHLIALASGVALELKQEPIGSNPSHWGPITGVIQLDLLNVVQGEGGGYVYARNEHGLPSRRKENGDDYLRHFLSSFNLSGEAATHEEYLYDKDNLQNMQTSGNFIKSKSSGDVQYIVDDCYPVHNTLTSDNPNEAHYWYIHGTTYVYNMYISAYTGAARMYQGSTGLQIPTGEAGTLNLKEVIDGYYCYNPPTADNPSPLPVVVDDVEYNHGDPISWWDYKKYFDEYPEDPNKDKFVSQISDFGQQLNNMSHENGFVLSLELNDPTPGSASDPFAFWNPTSYPTVDYPSTDYVTKGPSFYPDITEDSEKLYGQTHYYKNDYIPVGDLDLPVGSDLPEGLSVVEGYRLCIESLQLNTGGNFLLTKGVLVSDGDFEDFVRKYVAIKMETTEDQIDLDDTDLVVRNWIDEATDVWNMQTSECYKVTREDDFGGTSYKGKKKYDALEGWSKLSASDRGTPENPGDWKYSKDALDLLNVTDLNTRYINKPQEDVTLNAFSEAIVSLYMSRDSRLLNLQQNRNMTLHFQYTYGDTQEDHYINITIDFKNELPDVGRLEDPGLVLPGTKIAFKQPTVKAAYNVSGGGWEYYENAEDAAGHIRGKKFTNRDEPFYWYQDGYYVSYYAETMFGRSYSENSVEVKVANYHDLKEVLTDTENYRGIGMRKNYPVGTPDDDKQRSPKVYIDDYTRDGESGLDLLKELYDKTLTDPKLTTNVSGCDDLEIILKSDLEPGDPWETIGSGTGEPCFKGNLHGDGYTISGLTSSLFHSLCGNVYNLGVTGSFTSSGIADSNEGRIENCWVYTTGAPGSGIKPIATLTNGGIIVNSYYNDDKFTTGNPPTGAIGKDPVAFYNGNVTYELNGFYLKEHNRKVANGDLTGSAYETEGNLTGLTPNYVENRYADGDFVYAGGELLPQDEDIRYGKKTVHDAEEDKDIEVDYWYAQYPEDYIFFGQSLSYGHGDVTHQDLPGRIGVVDSESNRVYRAPAYFQNATASKAYYNDHAVFAAQSADGLHDVYPHMTAIDFTGYGTTSSKLDHAAPLLSFKNADLTQNLLVYAGASDKSVIRIYLDSKEPTYEETTATGSTGNYRSVAVVDDEDIEDIKGHAVYLNDIGGEQPYQAESDHFLVDRQEFFAPIEYSFTSVPTSSEPGSRKTRMWYQRKPDNYVVINEGWEVVSLPFTAELVTTQDKGEITHFYEEKNRNVETESEGNHPLDDKLKSHEYWLREYKKEVEHPDENYVAVFNYPDEVTGESVPSKTATNTFLWDYYYSKESRQDKNTDTYQQYYSEDRTYAGYPYLTAGIPYLIGFPGRKYYEFDLTGVFEPQNTKEDIAALGEEQVITFASKANGMIPVSSETAVVGEGTGTGYNFVPCLVESEHEANYDYVLNADGSSFDKVTSSGELTVPFRPFFTSTDRYNASRTRSILFGYGDKEETHEAEPREADEPGQLIIRSGQHRIIVSSSLRESTTIRIVNVSGITVRTFDIAPGETIETYIANQGVYIVQTINGHYTKKLAVK